MWGETNVLYIYNYQLTFYKYFKDYYDIIYMLELNGIKIRQFTPECMCKNLNKFFGLVENYICKCVESHFIHYNNILYYNGIEYKCTYKNIREELKDVIDEILSKNKVILNE
jgi:hypothetical protein